jgi:hypothetical protein
MLKRLLLLGLLCSAFLLLMSLMVSATAEYVPPRIPAVETALLPARVGLDFSGNIPVPSHTAPQFGAAGEPLMGSTSGETILPRYGRPYYMIFYHAFHFSDRAG